MAFSTYMEVVNRVLLNAGEAQIATSTDFTNTGGALLTKEQLQCKGFVDKVNRRIIRHGRFRYLLKTGTLTTTANVNTYQLPTGINVEDLKVDSFFITTVGLGTGPLRNMTYERWMTDWPSGPNATGVPLRYFNYPANGNSYDTLGFDTPPNQTLTIQYEYYSSPFFLVNYNDPVQIRDRDEDILWDFGQMWLEVSNSQGKAADFAQILDQLMQELKSVNAGDPSRPPSVTFRLLPMGMRKRNSIYVYDPNPP